MLALFIEISGLFDLRVFGDFGKAVHARITRAPIKLL
jgi:hypothetical protein